MIVICYKLVRLKETSEFEWKEQLWRDSKEIFPKCFISKTFYCSVQTFSFSVEMSRELKFDQKMNRSIFPHCFKSFIFFLFPKKYFTLVYQKKKKHVLVLFVLTRELHTWCAISWIFKWIFLKTLFFVRNFHLIFEAIIQIV